MDDTTTMQELKDDVRQFCEARDWDQFHNPKDLSIGIATEAAELLEHFRFKDAEEVRTLFQDIKKREEIHGEVVDILFTLLRFAQMQDIDISDAFKRKMVENERKYPVERAHGSNKKYTEL